ncbi:hypothetical protein [Photobacterium leiognathi]|uniref:PEGA domain-containing protein n=1 Tax=Photobacterium leiognathi TaxID=553611 RepID=A0A2T3M5D3_PHOLE|nr:hypothetical protein [Photobacterium leiognathi]PSV87117.1 hypothetical protein CTM89_18780 [Photobacterium leiognathi]
MEFHLALIQINRHKNRILLLFILLMHTNLVYSNEIRYSQGVNIINDEEVLELRKIQRKYDYDKTFQNLNREMSLHSARVWTYKNKKNELEEIKNYLSESVISIDSTSEKTKMDELLLAINEKSKIEKDLNKFSDLDSKEDEIKSKYSNLEKAKKKLNIEKRGLLSKIIERIHSEINGTSVSGNYYGAVNCNKNSSIMKCIEKNEFDVKNRIINDNLFLTEDSIFSKFDITGANLNLDGSLSFNILFSASANFSNKIYKSLNQKLGFELIKISLKSNVPAEWYIDGKLFGKGEQLEAEVPSGSHGIYATYKGKAKSSVEEIYKPVVLRYILDK